MNPPSTPPSVLKSATRFVGWALLISGLALSLFAGSLTGLRDLSETLQGLGFPAGTLCVAGFLLLTLASVGAREVPFESAPSEGPQELPARARGEGAAAPSLRALEDRLIGELERKHEGIKGELREMSARLEEKLTGNAESASDWPLAVGAEITPQQVRPGPRLLRPQPHPIEPSLDELEEEELEMTLELEEQTPDEARLWRHQSELTELGDIEDRLSGDISVDPARFEWNFLHGKDASPVEELQAAEDQASREEEPTAEAGPSLDPPTDTENIDWFEWDEDDLV